MLNTSRTSILNVLANLWLEICLIEKVPMNRQCEMVGKRSCRMLKFNGIEAGKGRRRTLKVNALARFQKLFSFSHSSGTKSLL